MIRLWLPNAKGGEVFLEAERIDLEAKLEEAQTHQKTLKREHKGQRSKAARKEANKRVSEDEADGCPQQGRTARISRTGHHPQQKLGEVDTHLTEAKKAISDLQADAARLSKEIKNLNRVASEKFRFR